jgi:hypothetical protein
MRNRMKVNFLKFKKMFKMNKEKKIIYSYFLNNNLYFFYLKYNIKQIENKIITLSD